MAGHLAVSAAGMMSRISSFAGINDLIPNGELGTVKNGFDRAADGIDSPLEKSQEAMSKIKGKYLDMKV